MFEYLVKILGTETFSSALLGTILAFLFAGVAWFIKSSYEKRGRESLSIAKLERGFVKNLAILDTYVYLIDQWVSALKQNAGYTCKFTDLIIDDSAHLAIGDMELVNKIIKINYSFQSLNDDLVGIHASFNQQRQYLLDGVINKKLPTSDLYSYEGYLTQELEEMKQVIPKIKEEAVKVLAHIKCRGEIGKYSLFWIIDFLRADIWPKVSEKKLEKRVKEIKDEIKR